MIPPYKLQSMDRIMRMSREAREHAHRIVQICADDKMNVISEDGACPDRVTTFTLRLLNAARDCISHVAIKPDHPMLEFRFGIPMKCSKFNPRRLLFLSTEVNRSERLEIWRSNAA